MLSTLKMIISFNLSLHSLTTVEMQDAQVMEVHAFQLLSLLDVRKWGYWSDGGPQTRKYRTFSCMMEVSTDRNVLFFNCYQTVQSEVNRMIILC